MEVAGQWRREWAGAAEFGKVTSGGVTRQVARAMEVLNASGPGSRMRVMRAAFHSTAGPGAPAASLMIHSSRRVISSGSQMLQSPTRPTKPLEISSTPLEYSPDSFPESNNYKVTEPDDVEISEPSKWRKSTDGSNMMSNDESSSTDNASIIDTNTRMHILNHTNLIRKLSIDSDSSDFYQRSTSRRMSPLLDSPVTLNTMKYKSFLSKSNDNWNDRRKSYSFENTSPLNETILHKNDTIALESSTDSGICRSIEIINEDTGEVFSHTRSKNQKSNTPADKEETFQNWLSKTRQNSVPFVKQHKPSYIVDERLEDKVSVQSNGKVSIALPMNNQADDTFQYTKNHFQSETNKRNKRVEFCKTELHFAAETGTVNIIATDTKPPSSNHFRRKRSAFVPFNGTNFDKPITLFGDKLTEKPDMNEVYVPLVESFIDSDETSTSSKSILKNKIPKPKPYLLGENMGFGQNSLFNEDNISSQNNNTPTGVSMINKQLEPEERLCNNTYEDNIRLNNQFQPFEIRTEPESPSYVEEEYPSSHFRRTHPDRNSFREDYKKFYANHNDGATNVVKEKSKHFQNSPVIQRKPTTRKLRDNELTYFGVNKNRQETLKTPPLSTYKNHIPDQMDDLQSVKLIQQYCSETESEDASTQIYQNVPIDMNFKPLPKPRTRIMLKPDIQSSDEIAFPRVHIIKPTIELDSDTPSENIFLHNNRRSRQRQDAESKTKSRSISEPPKKGLRNHEELDKSRILRDRITSNPSPKHTETLIMETTGPATQKPSRRKIKQDPVYVNIGYNKTKKDITSENLDSSVTANDHTSKKEMHKKSKTHFTGTIKHPVPSKNDDSFTRDNTRKIIAESPYGRVKNPIKTDTLQSESSNKSVKPKKQACQEKICASLPREERTQKRHSSPDKKNNTYRNKKREESRERSRSKDKLLTKSGESQHRSSSKTSRRYGADSNSSLKNDKHKFKEYVINYDDKNGAVSTVTKVKEPTKKRSASKTRSKSQDKSSLRK